MREMLRKHGETKRVKEKVETHLRNLLKKFKIEIEKYHQCSIKIGEMPGETSAVFTAQNGRRIEINCIFHDTGGLVTGHNEPILIEPKD